MSTALLWFRRDLRLTDNPALRAALDRHEHVIPVFIADFEAEKPWQPGAASRWWLHHSLTALQRNLEKRGSTLTIREGGSLGVLRQLIDETGATAVYWNRLYEPALIARDRQIKSALKDGGVEVESFNAALWCEPWELQTEQDKPYRVFTPFWRKLSTRLPPLDLSPAPARIPDPVSVPDSLALEALALLPNIPWDDGFYAHWQPGEAGAFKALDRFVEQGLQGYHEGRDRPAGSACSRLSPHLHFGEIGPQQVRAAIERASAGRPELEKDAEHYLRELGWREFAHHLLFHFPHTTESPMDERFAAFAWRKPPQYAADLKAWQQARTGIPIVDAGMSQLWQTGWMHNRVRMIAASLLTKNLRVPWQEGARWFWDTLVDASLANNTLGWQWVAGCGADAAPYFRIFNPVLQSEKFDPKGAYLRSWVPELERLPDDAIHAPWAAKPAVLARAGLQLDTQYPAPIVDLGRSRQDALEAYGLIKSGD
jgi:deoxyribodipyrimidine photo-lyase